MSGKCPNKAKRTGLLILAGLATACLAAERADKPGVGVRPAKAPAPAVMLRVVQDESSLEHRIGDYLTGKGLTVLYRNQASQATSRASTTRPGRSASDKAAKDEWLILLFSGENEIPDFRVVIDTLPSAHDPSRPGLITERAVQIRLYTQTYVRPARRSEVAELLCARHRQTWAGTYCIDTDNELMCTWVLNVTSYGLPAENVFDAMVRMIRNWNEFYPLAKPLLTMTKPTVLGAAPTPSSNHPGPRHAAGPPPRVAAAPRDQDS